MSMIEDGKGTGILAQVDDLNRLVTTTVAQSTQLVAAKKNKSYQIGSGVIVLTSSNESAVLFLQNNESVDLILTGINITSSDMTGSSGKVFLAKMHVKGTALSSGSSQVALNSNFGAADQLSAVITAGEEGASVTNGIAAGAYYIPNNTFFSTDLSWVLPKGTSVALSITPASGNTSFPISVIVEGHLDNV